MTWNILRLIPYIYARSRQQPLKIAFFVQSVYLRGVFATAHSVLEIMPSIHILYIVSIQYQFYYYMIYMARNSIILSANLFLRQRPYIWHFIWMVLHQYYKTPYIGKNDKFVCPEYWSGLTPGVCDDGQAWAIIRYAYSPSLDTVTILIYNISYILEWKPFIQGQKSLLFTWIIYYMFLCWALKS